MKIQKLTLVALSLLFLSASTCFDQDDEDKLPPETQSGRNTFGCLVNGKVWLPKSAPFSSVGTLAHLNEDYTHLIIAGNQSGNQIISFFINNTIIETGSVFNLSSDENSKAHFDYYNCYYRSYNENPGELIITKFDTVNKIVSGRFYFSAKYFESSINSYNCDNSFIITEGRFDLTYSIQL